MEVRTVGETRTYRWEWLAVGFVAGLVVAALMVAVR